MRFAGGEQKKMVSKRNEEGGERKKTHSEDEKSVFDVTRFSCFLIFLRDT